MREVNFSIPSTNKASVGITTALYDRRALDCSSTLPLINSLNHLAYLTTSSARIRDILTIDGGVERLVVILKEGRSKELMSMWKWNLAFQCVVNIGVRGSEVVRRRVVEADMVPVIATILDNYIQIMDRVDRSANSQGHAAAQEGRTASLAFRRSGAPAAIEIPPANPHHHHNRNAEFLPSTQRTHTGQTRNHQQQQQGHARQHDPRLRYGGQREPPTVVLTIPNEYIPVRADHRLPSMMQLGGPSQPVSPTTPNPPVSVVTSYHDRMARGGGGRSRHQRSMSGESDGEEIGNLPQPVIANVEPLVDIETGVDMEDDMLGPVDAPMTIATEVQDEVEPFNLNLMHRSMDGSINPTGTVTTGFSPNNQPTTNPALSIAGSLQMPSRFTMDGANSSVAPSSVPREEDVLMSLQLLAYVSKYCNLRTYFQKSHLVPRLSIDRDMHDSVSSKGKEVEEYLLPDDFNIFPLVEKFTVRSHPADMQYWAGVVMRNLCRKDESKGGIRQCAYYECGKWETFPRQFAKCRRCRRTKYCSKECQKSAWVYHRHWCVAAQP